MTVQAKVHGPLSTGSKVHASDDQSPWERPETVRGFVDSPPNQTLLQFAAAERARHVGRPRLLDLGCGAGRNAVPLANAGWEVVGIDNSAPMVAAAATRRSGVQGTGRVRLAHAVASRLPFASGVFDFVVAHGVWNLARSDAEFRDAVREASRAARAGAALFVFTFSRHTLSESDRPLPGETFILDGFSGSPQCFLTAEQLVAELAAVGFAPEAAVPLTEHNRRTSSLMAARTPVIYEGAFRKTGG